MDPHAGLEEGRWGLREGFPEIPLHVTDKVMWHTVFAGRFKFQESISVKEGRAAFWGLRHAVRQVGNVTCF